MSEDSLEPLITQCPNCDTRFRVSETQLQIAAGRVRCGACLAVFEGTAHLLLDGEEMASDTAPGDVDALLEELDDMGVAGEATALPDIDSSDFAALSQDELIELDDAAAEIPEELVALEAAFLEELRDIDNPRVEPSVGAAVVSDTATDPLDEATLDEPIAEPLGIDVPEATPVMPEDSVADAAAVDIESIDAEDDAPGFVGAEVQSVELPDQVDDKSVDEKEGAQEQEQKQEETQEETQSQEGWLDEFADDVWQEGGVAEVAADPELEQPAITAGSDQAASGSASTEFADEVIELQPVDVPPPPPPKVAETEQFVVDEPQGGKRSWVTIGLVVLALFALPAQVLWFQYETWVKEPALRPVYQAICDVAGCVLPARRDVTQIASKKSFIRSHPDRADARIVDVLMVNNADFAQPYPLIELTATSMRGELIAGRRFKPVEYLQGEVRDSDLLQPRTPVHVSLEIQDPDAQALNFEVHFR